jgi:hypothetical protein
MRKFNEDDINKIDCLLGYLIFLNEKTLSIQYDIIKGCIVEAGEWKQEIMESGG